MRSITNSDLFVLEITEGIANGPHFLPRAEKVHKIITKLTPGSWVHQHWHSKRRPAYTRTHF